MDKLYYLASPYSHVDKKVMEERYEQVMEAGVLLSKQGFLLFEPITTSHVKAQRYELPTNFEWWQRHNHAVIDRCDGGIIVLMIDGWDKSKGVQDEINYAAQKDKPIIYKTLEELRSTTSSS